MLRTLLHSPFQKQAVNARGNCITIYVSDLKKPVSFYQDVIGPDKIGK